MNLQERDWHIAFLKWNPCFTGISRNESDVQLRVEGAALWNLWVLQSRRPPFHLDSVGSVLRFSEPLLTEILALTCWTKKVLFSSATIIASKSHMCMIYDVVKYCQRHLASVQILGHWFSCIR